jgi:hypothetical protein
LIDRSGAALWSLALPALSPGVFCIQACFVFTSRGRKKKADGAVLAPAARN